jgi:hypothetical protein
VIAGSPARQERYGRYGMWEREICLSRERSGTVSPSRDDASSGRYGSGRLVDGVRDHGLPRMTKSHVPVRLLSDDTPICHLDPESVRQERALISTLAATIKTTLTQSQTSPTFPRENTQRSGTSLVDTDKPKKPGRIHGGQTSRAAV